MCLLRWSLSVEVLSSKGQFQQLLGHSLLHQRKLKIDSGPKQLVALKRLADKEPQK